jgi:glutamate--cysteine ligase
MEDAFMKRFNEKLINLVKEENLEKYLMNCNFGLEKENVRVDKEGRLVFTPHPEVFGDRLVNPYIKTDFSESQVEVATAVCNTIEETYDFLDNLQDVVSLELKDEYLWPQSTPPCIPEHREIPIANMGKKEEVDFRVVLAERYGRKKQLISGIHYNFSFREDFIKALYKGLSKGESYTEFKNEVYLKIGRNFMKNRWLPMYLTGASPVFHNSFIEKYVEESCTLDRESYYFPNMLSLRNSSYGYKNREEFYVSLNTVEEYINDINELVRQGELQDICEFYSPLRLKTGNNDNLVNELLEGGIKYLEFRILDINPLCKNGISKDMLYFMHLFVLYLMFKEEKEYTKDDHIAAGKSAELIALQGRKGDLELYEADGARCEFRKKALEVLDDIEEMLEVFTLDSDYFTSLVQNMRDMVTNPQNIYSNRIFDEIREKSFIDFHMEKAKEYLKESKKNENYLTYEGLLINTCELSIEKTKQ